MIAKPELFSGAQLEIIRAYDNRVLVEQPLPVLPDTAIFPESLVYASTSPRAGRMNWRFPGYTAYGFRSSYEEPKGQWSMSEGVLSDSGVAEAKARYCAQELRAQHPDLPQTFAIVGRDYNVVTESGRGLDKIHREGTDMMRDYVELYPRPPAQSLFYFCNSLTRLQIDDGAITAVESAITVTAASLRSQTIDMATDLTLLELMQYYLDLVGGDLSDHFASKVARVPGLFDWSDPLLSPLLQIWVPGDGQPVRLTSQDFSRGQGDWVAFSDLDEMVRVLVEDEMVGFPALVLHTLLNG